MARNSVNFASILTILLLYHELQNIWAIVPQRSIGIVANPATKQKHCVFNEEMKAYNATDLILCMDELALTILLQRKANPNKMSDRAYQEDSRQLFNGYESALDYFIPMGGGDSSNYYGDDLLSTLLSGGLKLPSFSSLFNFGSSNGERFNLFNALSSIAQYDDLKCVPRILCEVASGSMPGSLTYRQSSTFQNFGQNALFGLLTAFESGGASPILSFGKAALLGYTNRGQPSTCYQEYSRCPQNSDQLIYYLNNHNGGFFRFFNGNGNNYYRPQQSYYRPHYKNSVSEYRIVKPKTEYSTAQPLLGPGDDRLGTGKLTFSNANYNNKDLSRDKYFPAKLRESEGSRIIFPKDDRNHFHLNHIMKTQNNYNGNSVNGLRAETFRKERKFFPQEKDNVNTDVGFYSELNPHRNPRYENFGKKDSYLLHFPSYDTIYNDDSIFVIPNNFRNH